MTNSLMFSRLSLIGLLLLVQTGCSTTSVRNLFSWHRQGAYHSPEDLQKQSKTGQEQALAGAGPESPDPDQPASSTAENTTVAAATEKKQLLFGSPFTGSETAPSDADPFLKEDSATPPEQLLSSASVPAELPSRAIRRTAAAVLSTPPQESPDSLTAEISELAEQESAAELEARKLAELDALLEGRELAGARQLGREASVRSSQLATAAKRVRSTAASRAVEEVEEVERTGRAALQARREIPELLREEAPVLAESTVDDELAERLIPVENIRGSLDAVLEPEPADLMDEAEPTHVVEAEELFGELQSPAPTTPAEAADDSIGFRWKTNNISAPKANTSLTRSPMLQTGMQQESFKDPLFDEQPVSDAAQLAPTSGFQARDVGFAEAGAATMAPVTLHSLQPEHDGRIPSIAEVEAEAESGDVAEMLSASAELIRPRLIWGLSAWTWGLITSGILVLVLLFIPVRRKHPLQQTAAAHP